MIDEWSGMPTVLSLAVAQTLQMIAIAIVPTVVLGMLIGIVLVGTDADGILAAPFGSRRFGTIVHAVLGFIVNVGRSLPFIILMVLLIPFSRLIVGTFLGPVGASVPLTIAAIPFFARLAEIALREVDGGLIEAAKSLGATRRTIIWKVMLAEARPSIVLAFSTSVITLINYSAIAGTVGGGGIGDLAYRYGYQRYSVPYLLVTTVLLIIIVQVIQSILSAVSRRLSHR